MAIILSTRHISGLWTDRTIGPPVANADRTLATLAVRQAVHLAQNPAASRPQEISDPIDAYIGNGCWRIKCRCGERTHTDPEWKVAYCFGCGAMYTHVVFPKDRARIEDLLVKRPVQATRNWHPSESYDDLVAEQVAHGDPIV